MLRWFPCRDVCKLLLYWLQHMDHFLRGECLASESVTGICLLYFPNHTCNFFILSFSCTLTSSSVSSTHQLDKLLWGSSGWRLVL